MTGPMAGQVLGRYELLLPVAKGGMAQVWAARIRGTRGFQKIVAVKTILAGSLDDARMEEMLLEEATLASQIHHPNVVGTLELGEQDGVLYLVMEWVDGESLGYILARALPGGGIPLSIAVNIIGQACKGLHSAHELRDETGSLVGLVHRDLSTHNVLVTYSGTAKLVDFGIAKATARSSSLTEAGMVKGKFAYMSPEQVSGMPIDRRSDIFGMGVLLYLLTTGRHPFKGETVAETVRNVCLDRPPVAPSEIIPGYPRELELIVQKALSKSASQRYGTAHELLAALEKAMPAALEASFEAEVARYMEKVLGTRATERRTQLRLAQQMADRLRADGGSGEHASLGSLRTVAVGDGTASSIRIQKEGSTEITPVQPVVEAPVMVAPVRKSSWFGIAVGVGGLVMALALVAFDRTAFHAGNGANAQPLVLPPLPTASVELPPAPADSAMNAGDPPIAPEPVLRFDARDQIHASTAASAAPPPPKPVRRPPSSPARSAAATTSAPSATASNNAASNAALSNPYITAPTPTPAASPETTHSDKSDMGKTNAGETDNFSGRR
ncbi:MAG TPA: serine/threonine-protein kinase [Polyangiaceae bacterium]|jgi:tRNA A-37 threonylcarbamoyl transferase component Bud32